MSATSGPVPAAPRPSLVHPEQARMAEERERRLRIGKSLARIRHKILVMSGKGGVGKTTVAVNLAASLARRGFRAGVLDLDLTGPDVPLMFGLEGQRFQEQPGPIVPLETAPPAVKVVSISFLLPTAETPVVWRGPMKSQALSSFLGDVAWGDLDFLVVDLPPGTSDEPLSVSQAISDVSGVLIVTTPQGVATLDVRKSIQFAKLLQLRVLGVLENMSGFVCPHCGHRELLFGQGGGQRLADEAVVPFLGAVPIDPAMVQGGDTGRPFVLAQTPSASATAFEACVDRLLESLNEPPRAAPPS